MLKFDFDRTIRYNNSMRTNKLGFIKKFNKKTVTAVVAVLCVTTIGLVTWTSLNYKNWAFTRNLLSLKAQETVLAEKDVKGATSCDGIRDLEASDLFETITVNRDWFLLGGQFTESERSVRLEVTMDEEFADNFEDVDYKITYEVDGVDDSGDFEKAESNDLAYVAHIDMSDFSPKTYIARAVIETDCADFASEGVAFNVSYPVYVSWTFDWEGYDIKDQHLNDIDTISRNHSIPLTHFYNPRIYTNPAISEARRNYFTEWVKSRAENEGHSIELHLHMFPDMVEAAGVEPQTEPAWGWNTHDGYDILVMGYSYTDMVKILNWSKNMFASKGLGTPIGFRAGGWFADEGTLKAIQDTGFGYDSSGRTNFTIGTNNAVSPWYLETTTQPYQPSLSDQNSSAAPTFTVWEFPNNGGDSWAFSKDEMLQRFRDNYSGGINQNDKVMVTYLSHPEWFYEDKPKMEGLFDEISKYKYSSDSGPVIYINLDDAYNIWTSSE